MQVRTSRGVPIQSQLRSHQLFSENFEELALLADSATLYHTGALRNECPGTYVWDAAFKSQCEAVAIAPWQLCRHSHRAAFCVHPCALITPDTCCPKPFTACCDPRHDSAPPPEVDCEP